MSNVNDNIYNVIGKNIKKYRLSKGLSQERLSEIIGANSKFIGHVERFERYISLKKIIEIANFFDIPVKNLLE